VLAKLTDYDNKGSLVNRMRDARFRFFVERLETLGNAPLRLLDVGGDEEFWVNRGYENQSRVQITLLNLAARRTRFANMRSVKGNARDLSEFSDRQFDVVFSNSVIEHLYTYESQQAMAREVQRVGKYHFVQTPYRYFLFEPHYLLPGFQFLPKAVQLAILTKTSLSRRFPRLSLEDAAAILAEIRLLSEREFLVLFPHSRIYRERMLGMTKSLTAYNL
jgi:hypothetical protein